MPRCAGCGVEIEESRRGMPRKWCSERCRVRTVQPYVPAVATERVCRYCGEVFMAKGHRFRCIECQRERRMGALRECAACHAPFWPQAFDQQTCSKACAQHLRCVDAKPTRKGHRSRALLFGVAYEPVDRLKVFERDGWLCMLCMLPIDPDVKWPDPLSASLDHVVPLSRGGDHTYLNTQCAHLRCNIIKGAEVTIRADERVSFDGWPTSEREPRSQECASRAAAASGRGSEGARAEVAALCEADRGASRAVG